MAISIDDIKKLRAMTGAGLADVKKALTEAEGDFDKAKELLRERGLAIAAKRSDRETSNGCVLVKSVNGFAAMLAKAKDIEAVKALDINGQTAQEAVTQRSGITGEKMELDGYLTLEGDNIEVYNHMGKNTLCTMVQTNKPAAEQGHLVAMQVAAMKPVALDKESVEQKILDEEYKTAVEKTKLEQVEKFVEMKLKKAGLNPNLVDSEDHIESNMAKGWLTQAQADEARKIIADAKVEGEAQLKMPMIENIAKGRVQKFLKENCLVDQEFQFGDGDKATVAQWLAKQDKDLKIVAFKRFTLVAD